MFDLARNALEFIRLTEDAKRIFHASVGWEDKHDLIFSSLLKGRVVRTGVTVVFEQAEERNFKDEVRSYVSALASKSEELVSALDAAGGLLREKMREKKPVMDDTLKTALEQLEKRANDKREAMSPSEATALLDRWALLEAYMQAETMAAEMRQENKRLRGAVEQAANSLVNHAVAWEVEAEHEKEGRKELFWKYSANAVRQAKQARNALSV